MLGFYLEKNMQHIIDSIQLSQPLHRPFIIAISGFGGPGKTTLAQTLKEKDLLEKYHLDQADTAIHTSKTNDEI